MNIKLKGHHINQLSQYSGQPYTKNNVVNKYNKFITQV